MQRKALEALKFQPRGAWGLGGCGGRAPHCAVTYPCRIAIILYSYRTNVMTIAACGHTYPCRTNITDPIQYFRHVGGLGGAASQPIQNQCHLPWQRAVTYPCSVCVGSYPEFVSVPCTNMCQECSVYQPSGRLTPQSREAPLKDKSFHRCHPPESWNARERWFQNCDHIPIQNQCH